MLELRHYQHAAVQQLSESFLEHLRVIFRLDTGGGKTVVFSEIAFRAVKKNKTVLILTDRTELFKQASNSIQRLNIPICKINPDNREIYPEAKLFVGMVETVARRLELLKDIKLDLIIIDEAHKGNFFKILDAFPNVMTIGATATPINKRLHKYYTKIVDVISISELIQEGFLAPCKPYQMQDDFSDVKVEKNGEEFNGESLFQHFNKSKLYEGVVENYLAKLHGKKTIIFNVNIEHSDTMARAFCAAGIQSHSITSKTSEAERKYLLEAFSRGDFLVLNNCGILTTGYDEPSIEAVIVNRATLSLALWLQMLGRGSRPYKNKPYFIVLDFGMNHDRHGLWDEVREWSLDPPKKKKKGLGAAPVKICKGCEAMISAVAKKCQFCGYEYDVSNLSFKNGVLVEVKPRIPVDLTERNIADLNVQELAELQKTKLHTAQMIWRVVRSKGEEAVKEYAKVMDYGTGWAHRQIEEVKKAKEAGIEITFNNYKIKQVVN